MDGRVVANGRSLRRLLVVAAAAATSLVGAGQALAAPDFQILLTPPSQTLPPGGTVSYSVAIAAIDGFSEPVHLSVAGLPNGVTGHFTTNPIEPSGTSFLVVTAAAAAQTGIFSLSVTGTSAPSNIAHTTTGFVNVNFGLIKICYGAVVGRATDYDTGDPLPGVEIRLPAHTNRLGEPTAISDADGRYRIEHVSLGDNNSPREVNVSGNLNPSHWWKVGEGVVSCEAVTEINLVLRRATPANVTVRIVEGTPDPADYAHVIPTATPAEGVSAYVWPLVTPFLFDVPQERTGGDGLAEFRFPAGYEETPLDTAVYAFSEPDGQSDGWRRGFWDRWLQLPNVQPGDNLVRELALVRKCTSSVAGQVVDAITGLPIANAWVSMSQFEDYETVHVDAGGFFSVPNLLLARNNAPVTYSISAYLSDYTDTHYGADSTFAFTACGQHRDVTLRLPPKEHHYGVVEGKVMEEVDDGLQLPVAGITVYLGTGSRCGPPPSIACQTTTDADGKYRIEQVLTGDSADDVHRNVVYTDDFSLGSIYYPDSAPVEIRANQVTHQDLQVLRRKYARITGLVRDATTKQPIKDARVQASFRSALTDAQGSYTIDQNPLGDRNAPSQTALRARANGYWDAIVDADDVPLRADETTVAPVIEMIPVCAGATILGKVTDALTKSPIPGATVRASFVSDVTDANGDYRLEQVPVGDQNSPTQVTLSASAPGYFTQTRHVTVFCGGILIVDIGPQVSAIEGYVKNVVTGQPISGALVRAGFNAAVTNAAGYYKLEDAPLNPDGSARVWAVTAEPAGFQPKTQSVTVHPNQTARLDFEFGAVEPPATLVVRVETRPAGDPAGFAFTGSVTGSIAEGAELRAAQLSPGDYAVTQAALAGWDLDAVSCDDGGSARPSAGDATTGQTTFKLEAGETVVCTYVNLKRGSVSVRAQTDPAGSGGTFTYAGITPGSIADGGLLTATALKPGTYAATQSDPSPAFSLTSISCTDSASGAASTGDVGTRTATFRLDPGETITCSFVNTKSAPPPDPPPACRIDGQGKDASGRAYIRFIVTDGGLGLARHEVTYTRNATVTVSPYSSGSNGPVTVTATAIDKKKSLGVEVVFYDLAGQKATCDPIVISVVNDDEKFQDETFDNVPQAESRVTIYNGDPGLRKVVLIVNGTKFKEKDLGPNEVRAFDVAEAMRPGAANTITVRVRGKKGASALIVIADIP